MLAKFTNAIFGVVFLILGISVISLLVKLDTTYKHYTKLKETIAAEQVRVAKLETELNQKLVEVVYVPSIQYEEKIIQAKPIIEYVTTETVKIIDRPVFSNVCIDSDGLRLWNQLTNLSKDPTVGSKPSN